MHRAIDSFTDKHSNFAHARLLIVPERRRFAGITIDLFWDHFLSVHWQAYHQMPLPGFCQQVYRELEEHPQWHAGRMGEIVPLMKRQNWLMRYSSFEGMRTTLNEVSQRSRRIAPIADGIEDLTTYYEEHQRHFLAFMPELIAFVEAWKKKH